jgi:molybdopterin-guanine dinucleotide biosynthesis protein A
MARRSRAAELERWLAEAALVRDDVVAGIFVGGASRRMGQPKGLLRTTDGVTLVERWRALASELGIEPVLVGVRPEYAGLALPQLADEPGGVGPIGGLAALLRLAGERRALALACDMPFVTPSDVEALLAAPRASVVAPRREGRGEPLSARYDSPRVLPIVRARIEAGRRSLQGLLDEAGASEIALSADHLDDWDAPEDVRRRPRSGG